MDIPDFARSFLPQSTTKLSSKQPRRFLRLSRHVLVYPHCSVIFGSPFLLDASHGPSGVSPDLPHIPALLGRVGKFQNLSLASVKFQYSVFNPFRPLLAFRLETAESFSRNPFSATVVQFPFAEWHDLLETLKRKIQQSSALQSCVPR